MSEHSHKTRSGVSHSSRLTRRSHASEAAALARAEAEAMKAQIAFAEQEAKIKQEKARLEASLELLSLKRSAAAATAKAEALEAILETDDNSSHKQDIQPDLKQETAIQRTEEYAREQSQIIHQADPILEADSNYRHSRASSPVPQHLQQNTFLQGTPFSADASLYAPPMRNSSGNIIREDPAINSKRHDTLRYGIDPPDGYSYPTPAGKKGNDTPSSDTRMIPPVYRYPDSLAHNQATSDLVRYMARRDIISKGLMPFDDLPENYRAWRASFRNAIADLNLSYKEEIDLLVRWLGVESCKQVKRIQAIHVNDSRKGLQMSWQRLDECYGAPEIIEESMWQRVDSFENISSKDRLRLREFGDLLMELQAAKEEGDFPGLAILDTARGISHIVQKLPIFLQEKWMSQGSRYKELHQVLFPPFSFFVSFVTQQAKMRNDPGFILAPQSSNGQRLERPHHKNANQRTSVFVHKTETSPAITSQREPVHRKTVNPTQGCPIHRKPHPLHECRGFREKTLIERKAFLKQNNICYLCCASTSHLAKDCEKTICCTECNSIKHVSAMHPGPAPWTLKAKTEVEHGGEGQGSSSTADVSTMCTEVCRRNLQGRSCSKICLVSVYPTGHRERATKVYAILDDQSNRSLARSEFFELFRSKGHQFPYSLHTCAGLINTTGRRAYGFQLESLDRQVTVSLPTLIECDEIPDVRSEIPTPEVALHHKHLKRLATQIPKLDPNASILLLLGRDIIRIHKVRDHINGPHDSPYAQRLDMGWVIVGNVCLGGVHRPDTAHSLYTNTLDDGRRSLFTPCPNYFTVKESFNTSTPLTLKASPIWNSACIEDSFGHKALESTKEDDKMAFPSEDRASDLRDLDCGAELLPIQRSLGISWDLKKDALTFQVSHEKRPFTRRGVLSTVNSVYDPLGIAAPVTIRGKGLLRDLTADGQDWDAPLPEEKKQQWEDWRESLQQLRQVQVSRSYVSISCSDAQYKELCVFSDASVQAIAAVAYLKVVDAQGEAHIGLVLGKAKLTPRPELTIPRLELSAAVLAVDIAEYITAEIDLNIGNVSYFTDSKIVLGYIYNEKRRFYVFVSNRVQRIRRCSIPMQWHYVPTKDNPADLATRSISAAHLQDSMWFTGPKFLLNSPPLSGKSEAFDLINPTTDTDIRPEVTTLRTVSQEKWLGSERFCRFSSWNILTRAIACLIHIAQLYQIKVEERPEQCKGWHLLQSNLQWSVKLWYL